MNLLRRAVVNYVVNPDYYQRVFDDTLALLRSSEIFSEPVDVYWEMEFERVKDLYESRRFYSADPAEVDEFRKRIAQSLRF